MVNMQTCTTFEILAQRIELLESIMALPLMSSSAPAARLVAITKIEYEQELNEIDEAIKVYCSLPGSPEA